MTPAAPVASGRWRRLGAPLAIGLVALGLRLWFVTEEHPLDLYLLGDMELLEQRARAMLAGTERAADTFTPAGYPAFLAVVFAAGGGHAAVGKLHAMLGALTCVLVHRVAHALAGRAWVAALGALLLALYPPLIFYTGVQLTETLAAFLVTLAAWLALPGRRPPAAALAGLALGLAVATRPNLLLTLPPLAWLAWRERRREAVAPSTPPWSRHLATCLAAALLTLVPVVVHNSRLTGRLTGVATNGGINFLLAHCECQVVELPPGGRLKSVRANVNRRYFTDTVRSDHLAHEEGAHYREGLRRIAERPSRVLLGWRNLVEGLGLGRMGRFPEQAYWPGWMGHDDLLNVPARAIVGVLGLVLARLVWAARGGPPLTRTHALLLALLSSLVPVFVAFIGDPRVRVSLDPLLLALGAEALGTGLGWLRSRGERAPRDAPPGSGSGR